MNVQGASNIVNLSGSFDTRALIDAILEVERLPALRLTQQRDLITGQKNLMGAIRSQMNTLRDALRDLRSSGGIESLTSSISDPTALSATVGANASVGSYRVSVEQLARAAPRGSLGFASPTSDVGRGAFAIIAGGETYDLEMAGLTNSLEDVRDAINGSGAPVRATIVDVGGASPNRFRLVVASEESGLANDFQLDFSNSPELEASLGFTTLQTAQDARFTIDNITIERSHNRVDDVIPGVTLNLLAPTAPGQEIVLAVTEDDSALREKVQGFVDKYNAIRSLLRKQLTVDENTPEQRGLLFGDSTLRRIDTRLRSAAEDRAAVTSPFDSLSTIGVRRGADGSLSIDTSAFENALSADRDAVLNLFSDPTTGIIKRLEDSIEEVTGGGGVIDIRTENLEGRDRLLARRVEGFERRLVILEARLNRRFAGLDGLLSSLQAQGSALTALSNATSSGN